MKFYKKHLVIILFLLLIGIMTVVKILYCFDLYSDIILAITALIILWYTFETAEIRKSENIIAKTSEENLKRLKSPTVICTIFTNPDNSLDTRVRLSNLSDYPVAVKLNLNIKIADERVNFSPSYNGEHYWNLQYKEANEGHFSWLDLFRKHNLISEDDYKDIKNSSIAERISKSTSFLQRNFSSKPPKITMDKEVFCENEMGLTAYYPPMHYDYDYARKVWIPILTSDKPYWEYKPTSFSENN